MAKRRNRHEPGASRGELALADSFRKTMVAAVRTVQVGCDSYLVSAFGGATMVTTVAVESRSVSQTCWLSVNEEKASVFRHGRPAW